MLSLKKMLGIDKKKKKKKKDKEDKGKKGKKMKSPKLYNGSYLTPKAKKKAQLDKAFK